MRNRRISILLVFVGGLALTLGLWRGEAGQVMLKGIRICLECMGLG